MGTDVTGAAASLPGGLVSVESHDGGMSGTNRDDTGGLLDPLLASHDGALVVTYIAVADGFGDVRVSSGLSQAGAGMAVNTAWDVARRSTFMECSRSRPDTADGLFGRGEITIDGYIFIVIQ